MATFNYKEVLEHLENGWRNQPATEKQIAVLVNCGVRVRPGLIKGTASDLIAERIRRRKAGRMRIQDRFAPID